MNQPQISFKIELSGQGENTPLEGLGQDLEEKLVMLVRVMRAIAKDMKVTIAYPAVISLDDLEFEEPPR